MIRVLGIDHAAISVKNLEKSKEFYTQILGLKVSEREHQKPGVEYFLDCGTSLVGLIQGDEKEGLHPFKHQGVGANHIGFRVPAKDFDKNVEFLKASGVNVSYAKKRDRSWSCYFLDIDGNQLEMTSWPLEDGYKGD